MNLNDIVERTKGQMEAITGLHSDTISRFDRSAEGWSLGIDMLEHSAIPRTHDLIASFEVMLDDGGNVVRWRRTARFLRGQAQTEA